MAIILLAPGGSPAQDKQLSGDSLRQLLNPTEREHKQHEKEIKSDEMHLLLREKQKKAQANNIRKANENVESNIGVDRAGREGEKDTAVVKQNQGPLNNSNQNENEKKIDQTGANNRVKKLNRKYKSDRYIPPSWQSKRSNVSSGFQTDNIKKSKGPFFGIRMGSKIRAYLPQVTTNVEQNLTEIAVVQDVFGDYKTLEKNTKIYCKKTLNPGSNRLELLAVKGITPKGEEFKLKGIVLDINNVAGLVGAISTDGKTAKRTLSAGVFGVGEALAPILNDGSLVGAGIEAAADNVLKEKETESEKTLLNPLYTIYVNPQDIMIRVEETF